MELGSNSPIIVMPVSLYRVQPLDEAVDRAKPQCSASTSAPRSNATHDLHGPRLVRPGFAEPWGTVIADEEAGATGGLYEILDPASITTPIDVTDSANGTTTDPGHLEKRNAAGSLSFESIAIEHDGTMICESSRRTTATQARHVQVRADGPLHRHRPAADRAGPALAAGVWQRVRVCASRRTVAELARALKSAGRRVAIDTAPAWSMPPGHIVLRNAQLLQKLTGFYRLEDLDLGPIALRKGVVRATGGAMTAHAISAEQPGMNLSASSTLSAVGASRCLE